MKGNMKLTKLANVHSFRFDEIAEWQKNYKTGVRTPPKRERITKPRRITGKVEIKKT